MSFLKIFSACVALAFAPVAASAVTIAPTDPAVVQSQQSPCVISTQKCNNGAFAYFYQQNTGGLTSFDFSQSYVLSTVRNLIGDLFSIGVDLNDTGTDQILRLFDVLVDGTSIGSVSPGALANVHNGSGKSDYGIGVYDISSYTGTETITFRASMSGLNDGAESFFLYNDRTAVVPLPAAGLLLLGGIGGLAALRRRRKN